MFALLCLAVFLVFNRTNAALWRWKFKQCTDQVVIRGRFSLSLSPSLSILYLLCGECIKMFHSVANRNLFFIHSCSHFSSLSFSFPNYCLLSFSIPSFCLTLCSSFGLPLPNFLLLPNCSILSHLPCSPNSLHFTSLSLSPHPSYMAILVRVVTIILNSFSSLLSSLAVLSPVSSLCKTYNAHEKKGTKAEREWRRRGAMRSGRDGRISEGEEE